MRHIKVKQRQVNYIAELKLHRMYGIAYSAPLCPYRHFWLLLINQPVVSGKGLSWLKLAVHEHRSIIHGAQH